MKLRELLYADLARQYVLAGRPHVQPNFLRLLAHSLHYRFLPNILFRLSRSAYLAGIPLLPYFFTYANIVLFGMEITPKCEVGGGVFFPHPQGNVIGARRVGRSVTFVHGVMVGAINQDTAFTPEQRPIIGDNVVLNAGCRVLGGIEVGDGAVVGANSLVIRSVPPNTTVLGVPAEVIFRRGTEDSKIGKD